MVGSLVRLDLSLETFWLVTVVSFLIFSFSPLLLGSEITCLFLTI